MGRLPFLRRHKWQMDMYTRSSVARLPGSSFTHGAVRTGGFAVRASEVPEYARQSNEAGGPKYGPPYTPKAPAYVPKRPGLVPGAYVPSAAKPPGAPAKPGALPGGSGRRKVPFARERNAYNRATGTVKRYVLDDAKRARDIVETETRKLYREVKDASKAELKRLARAHAVDYAKHVGAKWATAQAKTLAWAYAKARAKAAFVKRAVRQTARVRAGAVNRAVRHFSRTHVVNPVYQASRAYSAARGWVSRHR